MRHYCTLFDRNYIDRGLALHRSLLRHCGEFTLHVLCLDSATQQALESLSLPGMTLISVESLESWDPELRAARKDRAPVEFYFTCKPVLLGYLLDRYPGSKRVEYLDSDLYFFREPEVAEREYAGSAVALSPHDLEARNADRRKYGEFNAGWVSVSGDGEGPQFVRWWRDRCMEWCRFVVEDHRFADQKYLDQVPGLFPRAVVVRHPGVNLAPWNIGGRHVELSEQGVRVEGCPLVIFHFHGVRQMMFDVFESGLHDYGVRLSAAVRTGIYRPYVGTLLECRRQLLGLPAPVRAQLDAQRMEPGALDLARQVFRTARAVARRTAA
jgi:hypothetical protein